MYHNRQTSQRSSGEENTVWRIVLILDEPDQRICAETLQACGMHVAAAGDPSDTREIGCDDGTVVVLDIGMFGATGVAILRRFVAEPPAVNALRIVVLADWGEPAMERLVLRLGADAFLTKPVRPAQLLSAIERLLAEPNTAPSPAVRAAS